MKFKEKYPDFAVVEDHILRARAERAAMIAQGIVNVIDLGRRGLRRLGGFVHRQWVAEADRRAVASDPFLKRSVPKT